MKFVFAYLQLVFWCLLLATGLRANEVLWNSSFQEGDDWWEGTGTAAVSEVSRRDGFHSLMIAQWKDQDAESEWLSPIMDSPGGPVLITFWAAENYWECPDISYSASVDVVNLKGDALAGWHAAQETGRTLGLIPIPRDESRYEESWLRGVRLRDGLVWTYHEAVFIPRGDHFQLSFNWPKEMARGEAYIADVKVTAGGSEQPQPAAAGGKVAETRNLILEISTPVSGNLFLYDDPLQFEALLYSRDGESLDVPEHLFLNYTITDYEYFFIAAGRIAFLGAAPVNIDSFYESAVGKTRSKNLHLPVVLKDGAAREPGRLFFIEMDLTDGEKVYASDTVTYGVLRPRDISPEEYQKAKFIGSYFSRNFHPAWRQDKDDSISGKQGVVLEHQLDYGWSRVQPEYPGPYNFGKQRPAHPKLVFLPNIEQIRGRQDDHPYGSVLTMAPAGAVMPDPLRPGRTTFDIDAYVEYILNYIRHHRQGIAMVIPSGLERRLDQRTIELHKKSYTVIKSEFPDLRVGFMMYGFHQDEIDIFFAEELYKYCDFIGNHFYRPSIDWSAWEKIQAKYRAIGLEPVPLVSTEFSRVGGMDQGQRSRDMMISHLDSFAQGMEEILYFNVTNRSLLKEAFSRGATDVGGGQDSGFLYIQRVDRPRVSRDIVAKDAADRWRRGIGRNEFAGDSFMPILQTMTFYNLVQNFEMSEFREVVKPDADAVLYLFDRDDATVAAAWLEKSMGSGTYLVSAEQPFTVQDMYGRTERLEPLYGKALITLDENPLVLIFDAGGVNFELTASAASLHPVSLVRGQQGEAQVTIPDVWAQAAEIEMSLTVDGYWPDIAPRKVQVEKDAVENVTVPFSVDEKRQPGQYAFTARLHREGTFFGYLRAPLHITDIMDIEVKGLPLTSNSEPGVRVSVHNHGDAASTGIVRFENKHFAPGMRREVLQKKYHIEGGQTQSVDFPIDRSLISLAKSYTVEVQVLDASGIELRKLEEVSFRAVERANTPISIDGDLSDWNRDELIPIPFARTVGPEVPDEDDLSVTLYTLWDDNFLYFAAEVLDNSSVVRADTVGIWRDDNIMLGLYPWGWDLGEPLRSGYYREHLGLCADGTARIFRVGAVPGGPEAPADAEIAVKRTAKGYTYEWAYSRADLQPLDLTEGGRFRLSLYVLDRDWVDKEKDETTSLKGIQFGGFNLNVDARPEKWCEFVLVKSVEE